MVADPAIGCGEQSVDDVFIYEPFAAERLGEFDDPVI
jgi:hypothetical protein